mgnify:CR=1 FL=1
MVYRRGGRKAAAKPSHDEATEGRYSRPMAACTIGMNGSRISVAILAGGESRRMGRDKGLLPLGGKCMIEAVAERLSPYADELIIGSNDAAAYAFTGFRVVPDLERGHGPMMGVLSCLEAARNGSVLFAPCDVPVIPDAFVRLMLETAMDADIAMPLDELGRPEPLLAAYSRRTIPAIRRLLEGGVRRMAALMGDDLRSEYGLTLSLARYPDMGWYRNVNTMADYESLLAELAGAPAVERAELAEAPAMERAERP